MSNFALIPVGSQIVYDVIVATQSFIDTAPAEWTAQWAYIVNVDGVQCGPGWVYDPNTGSFYPPAPPPPPPSDTPIVSYDQLLASQGLSPDVSGVRTVTAVDPTSVDTSWSQDRQFQGVQVQVAGHGNDDNVDFLVVNPMDESIIGQWGTAIPVPPDGKISVVLSATASVPAGIVLRLVYHGTVGAQVYVQYRTWYAA
jgi:hypothetical protein